MINKYALFVVVFILAVPGVAQAQETWTGPYVGVYADGSSSETGYEDYGCWTACTKPTVQSINATVGGTAGFDIQTGDGLVLGLVGDVGTGGKSSFTAHSSGLPSPTTTTWRSDIDYRATVRARIGITSGKALVYVTGGIAMAHGVISAEARNFPTYSTARSSNYDATWRGTMTGAVYGAGIEYAMGPLSFKSEFLLSKFAPVSSCFANSDGPNAGVCWPTLYAIPALMRNSYAATGVRLGLNYRF